MKCTFITERSAQNENSSHNNKIIDDINNTNKTNNNNNKNYNKNTNNNNNDKNKDKQR